MAMVLTHTAGIYFFTMTVTCLLGFLTIDSSIWVAQMTGLPNLLHLAIICFWAALSVEI